MGLLSFVNHVKKLFDLIYPCLTELRNSGVRIVTFFSDAIKSLRLISNSYKNMIEILTLLQYQRPNSQTPPDTASYALVRLRAISTVASQ